MQAADLAAVSAAARAARWSVALVELPYRVAGRRAPDRPERLDAAFIAAVRAVHRRGPLALGGRSMGGRVACRTASELGAVGVVALAFPLRPPGRPGVTRAQELVGVGVPVLVVQGDRDAFGGPSEVAHVAPNAMVVAMNGADHSLRKATIDVAAAVVSWLSQLVDAT